MSQFNYGTTKMTGKKYVAFVGAAMRPNKLKSDFVWGEYGGDIFVNHGLSLLNCFGALMLGNNCFLRDPIELQHEDRLPQPEDSGNKCYDQLFYIIDGKNPSFPTVPVNGALRFHVQYGGRLLFSNLFFLVINTERLAYPVFVEFHQEGDEQSTDSVEILYDGCVLNMCYGQLLSSLADFDAGIPFVETWFPLGYLEEKPKISIKKKDVVKTSVSVDEHVLSEECEIDISVITGVNYLIEQMQSRIGLLQCLIVLELKYGVVNNKFGNTFGEAYLINFVDIAKQKEFEIMGNGMSKYRIACKTNANNVYISDDCSVVSNYSEQTPELLEDFHLTLNQIEL